MCKSLWTGALLLAMVGACVGAQVRTWTDVTGRFTTEAELAGFEDGIVRLKKSDGKIVSLPLEKLSKADQQYVTEQAPSPAGAPAPTSPNPLADLRMKATAGWSETIFVDEQGKPKPPPLEVAIVLTGKPAAEASAFGFVRVESATDGRQNTLTPAERPSPRGDPAGEFVTIDRSDEFFARHPKGGVRIPLAFEHPAKPIQKVALVQGTFKLRTGGRQQVIVIERVMSQVGKPVRHESLQAAGLDVELGKQGTGGLTVRTRGKVDELGAVFLLTDPSGERLRNLAVSSSSFRGVTTTVFACPGAPPPNTQLRITLHLNAQEVEVPFEFKDLKVPRAPKTDGKMPFMLPLPPGLRRK